MKGGMTAHIRVNPKDCIHVLRILDTAGVDRKGMSFASCTSLALSTLIGLATRMKVIEESDGFDYLEMMSPYMGTGNNKKKHDTTAALYDRALHSNTVPTVLPPVSLPVMDTPTMTILEREVYMRDWKDRISILNDRKEAGLSLTAAEQVTWNEGMRILFDAS